MRFVDDDGAERYGYVEIPAGTPGVHINDDWDALGMRASGSHSVTFDGVELAASALRGGFPTGEPVPYLERNLPSGLFHASASLGIAEAAFARAARPERFGDDARARMLVAESAIDLATRAPRSHEQPSSSTTTTPRMHVETVVIGAGQAGVALSRHLTAAGHGHVVLERGRVGERWRSERWDSLTLLTPNWLNGLPARGADAAVARSRSGAGPARRRRPHRAVGDGLQALVPVARGPGCSTEAATGAPGGRDARPRALRARAPVPAHAQVALPRRRR